MHPDRPYSLTASYPTSLPLPHLAQLPMYYRNAHAAILVYDVTDPSTIDKLPDWVAELQQRGSPDIILTIASNKADLAATSPNPVNPEEAARYARSINASLFETSAKTGNGIEALFQDLVRPSLLFLRVRPSPVPSSLPPPPFSLTLSLPSASLRRPRSS